MIIREKKAIGRAASESEKKTEREKQTLETQMEVVICLRNMSGDE